MDRLFIMILLSLVSACASKPELKEDHLRAADSQWETDFRYDFSCSLRMMSVGSMALDLYAYGGKLGILKKIVDRREEYADDLSLIRSGDWKESSQYLHKHYTECMNGMKSEHDISDQHMTQVGLIRECIDEYDQYNFGYLSWAIGLTEAQALNSFIAYRDSVRSGPTHDNSRMKRILSFVYGVNSSEDTQNHAKREFFTCKRMSQDVYKRVSPEKLQRFIQESITDISNKT